MRKHTTLNVDSELLSEAQAVLGTTGTTDTIHRALEAVVREHWRWWLIENPVNLTSDELETLRRGESLVNGAQMREDVTEGPVSLPWNS